MYTASVIATLYSRGVRGREREREGGREREREKGWVLVMSISYEHTEDHNGVILHQFFVHPLNMALIQSPHKQNKTQARPGQDTQHQDT